jgi:hypothetical protein
MELQAWQHSSQQQCGGLSSFKDFLSLCFSVALACPRCGLDRARLGSTSSKLCLDPVCLRRPCDPLVEEILAESRMLDDGVGVAGREKELLHFCWRFDCRHGLLINSS